MSKEVLSAGALCWPKPQLKSIRPLNCFFLFKIQFQFWWFTGLLIEIIIKMLIRNSIAQLSPFSPTRPYEKNLIETLPPLHKLLNQIQKWKFRISFQHSRNIPIIKDFTKILTLNFYSKLPRTTEAPLYRLKLPT